MINWLQSPVAISESQNPMGKKVINEIYYSHTIRPTINSEIKDMVFVMSFIFQRTFAEIPVATRRLCLALFFRQDIKNHFYEKVLFELHCASLFRKPVTQFVS